MTEVTKLRDLSDMDARGLLRATCRPLLPDHMSEGALDLLFNLTWDY